MTLSAPSDQQQHDKRGSPERERSFGIDGSHPARVRVGVRDRHQPRAPSFDRRRRDRLDRPPAGPRRSRSATGGAAAVSSKRRMFVSRVSAAPRARVRTASSSVGGSARTASCTSRRRRTGSKGHGTVTGIGVSSITRPTASTIRDSKIATRPARLHGPRRRRDRMAETRTAAIWSAGGSLSMARREARTSDCQRRRAAAILRSPAEPLRANTRFGTGSAAWRSRSSASSHRLLGVETPIRSQPYPVRPHPHRRWHPPTLGPRRGGSLDARPACIRVCRGQPG